MSGAFGAHTKLALVSLAVLAGIALWQLGIGLVAVTLVIPSSAAVVIAFAYYAIRALRSIRAIPMRDLASEYANAQGVWLGALLSMLVGGPVLCLTLLISLAIVIGVVGGAVVGMTGASTPQWGLDRSQEAALLALGTILGVAWAVWSASWANWKAYSVGRDVGYAEGWVRGLVEKQVELDRLRATPDSAWNDQTRAGRPEQWSPEHRDLDQN
jgi:hypothetical protein